MLPSHLEDCDALTYIIDINIPRVASGSIFSYIPQTLLPRHIPISKKGTSGVIQLVP